MKPLLKWAGGKRRLVPQIIDAFGVSDAHRRVLVEPFAGAAALTYAWVPREDGPRIAILGDANPTLRSFYYTLEHHPDRFLRHWRDLYKGPKWHDHYYDHRAMYNRLYRAEPRAALFLWLNHTCFNGLYRVNKKGKFNVPAGKHTSVWWPTEEEIKARADVPISVYQNRDDFFKVTVPDSALVYCDPPYVPLDDTAYFTSYTADGFSWQDQVDLVRLAALLARRRKAIVVLSNHDTPEIRDLWGRAGIKIVDSFSVRRSIGGKGSSRKRAQELLGRIGPSEG